jgi:hypothetical protein
MTNTKELMLKKDKSHEGERRKERRRGSEAAFKV